MFQTGDKTGTRLRSLSPSLRLLSALTNVPSSKHIQTGGRLIRDPTPGFHFGEESHPSFERVGGRVTLKSARPHLWGRGRKTDTSDKRWHPKLTPEWFTASERSFCSTWPPPPPPRQSCFPREHNSLIREEADVENRLGMKVWNLRQSGENPSSNSFTRGGEKNAGPRATRRRRRGVLIYSRFLQPHIQHNCRLSTRQEPGRCGATYLGVVGDVMLGQSLRSVHPCFIWNDKNKQKKNIMVRKWRMNQRVPRQARMRA